MDCDEEVSMIFSKVKVSLVGIRRTGFVVLVMMMMLLSDKVNDRKEG